MILISAFLSLCLLALALRCFEPYPAPRFGSICCVSFAGVFATFCIQSPAVTLQVLGLVSLFLVLRQSSKRAFATIACGMTAGVYALFLVLAGWDAARYRAIREEHPFASLENRLAPLRTAARSSALPPAGQKDLEELSRRIDSSGHLSRYRVLSALHNQTMESFVNAPGFGVGRMYRPDEKELSLDSDVAIAQPGSLGDVAGGNRLGSPRISRDEPLFEFHRSSIVNFVNPRGFGYVKSRAEVTGFQPHFFRSVPTSFRWQVRSIELVGLLKHDGPVVYLTSNLPRMEELRSAPTRPLDAFEAAGLDRVKQGETLLVQEFSAGMRMVGAIRSVDACTKCHGGEEGALLGAFSYALVKIGEPVDDAPAIP